uniref:N-acetylgalactosaminide beta-1,3-galactosyltransferase n=1 Tax=Strongyloides stercoralis TaxID=6248 RepID=A0A913I6Y1_STRER
MSNIKLILTILLVLITNFLLSILLVTYFFDDKSRSIKNSTFVSYDTYYVSKEKQVKIFCIILTSKNNHLARAIHQKNTWVKRCDNYIFGSGEENKALPAIKACHSDFYHNSFCKFRNTIKWAWKNNGDKYDWYIKLDDDSYVIMENLRAFLSKQNESIPEYHGLKRMDYPRQGDTKFAQGGAGYVMSKETVKLLVEKGLDSSKYCSQMDTLPDDVEVARCLEKLGIKFNSSVDRKNKDLFNEEAPESLASIFNKNINDVLSNNSNETVISSALDKVSDYPISFHRIRNQNMYVLEYFFYRAKVVNKDTPIDQIYKQMN